MTLIGCFEQQFQKLLPYLKSVPSKFSHCKIWCKNKRFSPDRTDLDRFGLEFENNVTFEISAHQFA